ncbi:MAG TPA: hemerythrin domain-containing protein [Myxococcaceae bacterium]|nr:hemerythrin domain-containing protein [Myxococcaceae bacterium]
MKAKSKSGTMLEGHHARLERLFVDVVSEAKKDDRKRLREMWSEFERGLRAHIAAEEADLLPGYERAFPAEAALIRRDHTFFESTLTEFGVNLDLHLLREQAVEDFGRRLHLHAETEDHGLYPWAEKALGAKERARIREHLQAGGNV